jgi:DNA-binding response OmpR family regulator
MTGPPLRILVVEDEMMVAFFIEDCLDALGHKVVGPASRVAKALRLIETESFDLALLDINVAARKSIPSPLSSRGAASRSSFCLAMARVACGASG